MTDQDEIGTVEQITDWFKKLVESVKQSKMSALDVAAAFSKAQVALDQAFDQIGPNLDDEGEDDDESDAMCHCGDPDCLRPFGHEHYSRCKRLQPEWGDDGRPVDPEDKSGPSKN